MKILDFKIRKGSFNLTVKNIEFQSTGIHLLKGRNGSGKTTFIETILKQDKIVGLNVEEKSKRIAYFAQALYKYPMKAKDYIGGYDFGLIKKYCDYFEVDYLNKNILNLSGGEFVILSIIRTIVKDTPVMIFDEPTNNLDDGKTGRVNALLNELANDKMIIVSTHDPRLVLNYQSVLLFENGEVAHEKEKEGV